MDYFRHAQGEYCAEDVPVSRIAAEIGTPFYCYSTATLTRHYRVFEESFKSLQPKPKICYAVKANGSLAVIATLARLGAGADVVSMGEIMLAQAAGVQPRDIVFSGVGKTAEEMSFALKEGIFQFNVESEPELRLLDEVARGMGTRAPVAVRVNPDVAAGTHAKISTGGKETKFGVGMAEALPLYRVAADLKNISLQGVSVHIGSQLTSLAPFAEAFALVRDFVLQLRKEGIPVHTVDLGGGLGVPYGREEPPLPAAYAEIVQRTMADLGVQLVFEPGRVLAGNAGILVTRVIYVKRGQGRTFVVVDAGMNDLLRPTLYEAYHEIVPVVESKGTPEAVDVVGPVCETGDIFAEGRKLPLPRAGDLLALRTAGAYGASMASTYNARPMIAEVMVNGKEYAVVRPRQTYEELIGAGRLPGWLTA